MFNKDGIFITDPGKILQEIEKSYSDLYKADSLTPYENLLNSCLENPEIPRLAPENAKFLRREINGCRMPQESSLIWQ